MPAYSLISKPSGAAFEQGRGGRGEKWERITWREEIQTIVKPECKVKTLRISLGTGGFNLCSETRRPGDGSEKPPWWRRQECPSLRGQLYHYLFTSEYLSNNAAKCVVNLDTEFKNTLLLLSLNCI